MIHRAYEESLIQHIERLKRWIAESEALAARTSDRETRQLLSHDLVRWQEARAQQELALKQFQHALRRTTMMNWLVSRLLAAFAISFTGLLLFSFLFNDIDNTLFAIVVGIDMLIIILSAVGYLVAVVIRDAVALGRQPWRFSLRGLLALSTVTAILLGLLTYTIRH